MQISAIKLQSGSYALWMGMYAAVSQMRAVVEAGPEVVEEPYLKRCTHHYHLIFFHCVAWVLGFLIGGFYRYAEGILSKVIMGKRTKLVRLYLFCQPH